jgi:hypothetical protein
LIRYSTAESGYSFGFSLENSALIEQNAICSLAQQRFKKVETCTILKVETKRRLIKLKNN